MKTINVEKWNPMGVAWYYKSEGKHSAEQFCDDLLVPELNDHKEPFTVVLNGFKVGVSSQMLTIMAFYLMDTLKYSYEELTTRIVFKGYLGEEQNDFLIALQECQHEQAKRMLKY